MGEKSINEKKMYTFDPRRQKSDEEWSFSHDVFEYFRIYSIFYIWWFIFLLMLK